MRRWNWPRATRLRRKNTAMPATPSANRMSISIMPSPARSTKSAATEPWRRSLRNSACPTAISGTTRSSKPDRVTFRSPGKCGPAPHFLAAGATEGRKSSTAGSRPHGDPAGGHGQQRMKIDSVDFFYLSMPVVTTEADGSQDALLVRAQAGPHIGWGECEASPLTCIASYVCPMSHGACRPVAESVLGQPLNEPKDIARIRTAVQFNSMDLLQAPHTFSGIEIALWDALGKMLDEPVYRLLGYKTATPKLA